MLIFAPPGLPGDPCAGVQAFVSGRAPTSPFVFGASVALIAAFSAVVLLVTAIFLAFPHALYIRQRGVGLTLITNVIYLATMISNPIYKLTYSTMPCVLLSFVWIIATSLQASLSCVRFIRLLNQGRFHKATMAADDLLPNSNRDSQSLGTSRSTFSPMTEMIKEYDFSMSTMLLSALGVENSKLETVDPGMSSPQKYKNAIEDLRRSLHATKTRSLIKVLVVFQLPAVIVLLIVWFTQDAYRSNCVGCDLFAETFTAYMVVYLALLYVRLRVAKQLQREGIPDPFGVVKIIKVNAAIFLILSMTGFVLYTVDPGLHDYNQETAYLELTGFVAIIFIVINDNFEACWRTIYHGLHSKTNVRDRSSSQHSSVLHGDFIKVLEDEAVASQFMIFAAQHYISESALFLRDLRRYRSLLKRLEDASGAGAAKLIAERYVFQTAPFQINISASVREVIENALGAPIDEAKLANVFDDAEKELVDMLSPVWRLEFVPWIRNQPSLNERQLAVVESV